MRAVNPGSPYQEWAETVVAAFRAAGFERVAVEASNVSGSPYRYVYVYLSDAEMEGPYALVSQAAELEPGNDIWVGYYRDLEDVDSVPETVETIAEAVVCVRRYEAPEL